MNISIYSDSALEIIATPHDNNIAWISIKENNNILDIFFNPSNSKKLLDFKAAVDKLIEAYPPPVEVEAPSTYQTPNEDAAILADEREARPISVEDDDFPF